VCVCVCVCVCGCVVYCGADDHLCHAVLPDPWLEGFFQVHDNARAKQRSRKNVLLSDPKQHLNSLTLQCEKPDQAFYGMSLNLRMHGTAT